MVFKLIQPAPLTEKIHTSDSCIYMERGMWILGWLPPKEGLLRYLCLAWSVVPFVWSVGYLPLGMVGSYITQIKMFSPGDFLTSIQVGFNAYGSSTKTCIVYWKMGRLIQAKNLMNKLDSRCSSWQDREKIHKMVARCNYIFLVFAIIFFSYATTTYLSAVLAGHPPWQLYNPLFNWRDSVFKMWLASTIEYLIMLGACVQDQLADVYPLIYTVILRVHLNLLKQRIAKLRTNLELSTKESYEELVECIMDHKLMLEYCNLIRPVISGTIFTQFLLIGIVLGLALINVFFFSDLWTGLASLTFIVVVLLQTFPTCYNCNLVMEDCEAMMHAIFQSNWIDANYRYKTTMMFFLANVRKPISFSAGGFFQICMASNISVAKFAFSVITIVNQMNIAEKFKTD